MEDMVSCNEAYFDFGQVCNTGIVYTHCSHTTTPAVYVSLFPYTIWKHGRHVSCNEAYFVFGQVCNTTQGFGDGIHSL